MGQKASPRLREPADRRHDLVQETVEHVAGMARPFKPKECLDV
jgi:hypothetical protein